MGEAALAVVAKTRSLASKLAELYTVIERIPKRGWNDFHKYHYPLEADVADAMRTALARLNVVMLPNCIETKVERYETSTGKKEWLTTLRYEFKFVDGESGESEKTSFVGQGSDPGDKGAYKATTGAVKYAILKQALVPTGDDPEDDNNRKLPTQLTSAPSRPANSDPRPSPPRDIPHDAQTGEVSGHPPDAQCPAYGSGKGKMLSELSAKDLAWYEGNCLKSIADPSKSKWVDKERATLAGIRAWIAFRSA